MILTLFSISQVSAVLALIMSSNVIQRDLNSQAEIVEPNIMIWMLYPTVPLLLKVSLALLFLCSHRAIRRHIMAMNYQPQSNTEDGAGVLRQPNKIKIKYPLFLV